MRDTVLTARARDVCQERAIPVEWAERTIIGPDILEADLHRPGTLNAFRSIPEHGGRILRVVYVADSESFRVVTAFFDRRRKP